MGSWRAALAALVGKRLNPLAALIISVVVGGGSAYLAAVLISALMQ